MSKRGNVRFVSGEGRKVEYLQQAMVRVATEAQKDIIHGKEVMRDYLEGGKPVGHTTLRSWCKSLFFENERLARSETAARDDYQILDTAMRALLERIRHDASYTHAREYHEALKALRGGASNGRSETPETGRRSAEESETGKDTAP